jgi:hypothetical protein
MAREYVISAGGITLANQPVSLVVINPSATQGFEILRCWVSQSQNATSAQQRVQLVTQVTVFPTVVTATPAKTKMNDPASGIVGIGGVCAAGKCGINASGEGAGSKTVILEDSFNVLNGWLWVPTPKETIILGAGLTSCFNLFLPVAAAQFSNWSFGVAYAEIG